MTAPTFAQVFEQWYGYYDRTVATKTSLETHRIMQSKALPIIGDIAINDIKPKQVLDLSNAIAMSSTYYARRVADDIIRVIDYAVIILQVLDYNYIARITNFLVEHKVVGRRFVDLPNIPVMLQDIEQHATSHDTIKRAFWVLVYTGLRRSEVALAKKCEFDLTAGTWVIPAERMKVMDNGQHIVPLSSQVIELIKPLFDSQSDYLFASPTKLNQPINPWSLYYPLKQSSWQYQQTLHGFRKIFSTHAHLSNLWSIDSIELSLAHKITGVRGVYNHAKYLDERAKLMQWYADEVDKWRGIS